MILFCSSLAYSRDYTCPKEIETEQALKTKTTDWSSMIDIMNGKQYLRTMSVFDGHPSEGASLVPDIKGPSWTFPKIKERSIWLMCEYNQTTVRLIKELAKDITSCVFHDTSKNNRTQFITCK